MEPKHTESLAEINMMPLVDIMLVLLIVFIIAAPLIVPQTLGIELPETVATATSVEIVEHQLFITATGQVKTEFGTLDDEALFDWLADIARQTNSSLIIDADKSVNHGRVAEVMSMAEAAGVKRLAFRTMRRIAD